jgi:hypothetical protein
MKRLRDEWSSARRISWMFRAVVTVTEAVTLLIAVAGDCLTSMFRIVQPARAIVHPALHWIRI